MQFIARATALFAALTTLVCTVQAISQVTRQGRYLYTSDGNRFYIKGVAYQEQGTVVQSTSNPFGEPSTFTDPLALSSACARDLPYLQALGVNTIRVYSVDSTLNHDACMTAFSNAGIYTIIDLALPLNGSIDRTSPSWSTNLLDQYIKTIDAFSKYNNVLAYNVGNEVVISNTTAVAPYVKAAARDIKAYLASKSSSALVGYSAIDGAVDFKTAVAEFFSCDPAGGNSGATSIDIYGLNNYEWCGASDFQTSGYAATTSAFQNYNVVAYFSEFGCITSPPRLWTEVAAMFSTNMSPVFSGGIAFSYLPATSVQGQFGMVTISTDGNTVTTSNDYTLLKAQYGNVTGPNSPSQAGAGTPTYPNCPPTSTAFVGSVNLPPTPNESECNCLESNLSCVFTPATANYTTVVGSLLDTGCSLLGQKGASCSDIGGDGQAGTYGRLSGCDPTIKLSYVMSEWYELNAHNAQACSFSGNGTVNPLAASTTSAANAAATSCLANFAATFVPTAPTGGSASATGSGSSASTSTGAKSGAVNLIANTEALVGMAVVALVSMGSIVWTLA